MLVAESEVIIRWTALRTWEGRSALAVFVEPDAYQCTEFLLVRMFRDRLAPHERVAHTRCWPNSGSSTPAIRSSQQRCPLRKVLNSSRATVVRVGSSMSGYYVDSQAKQAS